MTIHVECSECGESRSLRDNAAGRKLKCRCGATLNIPEYDEDLEEADDDGGERPMLSRTRISGRRRRGRSTPWALYALYAGGGVVGLLVLFFAFQALFGAANWKQDLQVFSDLDQEQAGAGYAIRLPKGGWRQTGTEHSSHSSPVGQISSDEAVWKGPTGRIEIRVTQHPGIRGRTRPTIHTSGNTFVDTSGEPLLVLPGATITSGQISGRLFTRALFHSFSSSVGITTDGFPHHLIYVSYFDDQRVDVIASTRVEPDGHDFQILEESLKSVRKLLPGETIVPPVLPRPPGPSATPGVPFTAGNGSTRSPEASPSGLNGNRQVADANSSRTRNNRTSGFKKSDEGNATPPERRGSGPGGFNKPVSKADWGEASGTKPLIATQGERSSVAFADLNPNLLLVDDQLFDVDKGETVGTFPIAGGSVNNQLRALSPDGQFVATATSNSVESAEIVTIQTLGGKGFGKPLSTNGRGQQSNRVQFLAFSAPNRLVAGVECQGTARGSKIFIFNMETGKVAKEINCTEIDQVAALSPDGKYLANHTRSGIPVYDLQKGMKVAAMERPGGTEGTIFNFGDCHGLAFAPDGTELAALLNRNRVIVWSAKGKIVFDEILTREMGSVFDHRADGIQWLPDGRSWLLGLQFLLQREQKLLVWNIQRAWPYDRQPVRVLNQDHVLAVVNDNSGGDVVQQKIPWDEINRQTDAANLDEIALVRPGDPMSIEVQVFNVRFGNPQEVANALGTSLTKRIELSKFKVQQGQNVILKATYNEEQGEQKRVVQGPFLGNETGQRVNDSKGKLDIKIVTKDKGEVAWEQTITSNGGLFIEGEISDASVRNRMFKFIEARVNQLALPTLIPKPGSLQLPLETKLER